MIENPKISLIGSGNMGEALIAGLLHTGLTSANQITASGPRAERGLELEERYGVCTATDNVAAITDADLILLSVKPQRLTGVLKSLRGRIPSQALVLSIVAGAAMRTLKEGLDHQAVVRSMPNTPAQIGQGITVWIASSEVNPDQIELARRVLTAVGQELQVEDEHFLDMATALSGTGPAYVFLFMEAMIDAGVHMGFPRRIAEQLVVQTLRGSVDYYKSRKTHVSALRNEVTSPGGTSAEALYYLEKAGFRTAISRAVWAAYERSQELGQGRNSQSPEKKSGS